MWTRKDIKSRGKETFKKNYWKCVLVALIIAFISGGTGGFSGGTSSLSNMYKYDSNSKVEGVEEVDEESLNEGDEASSDNMEVIVDSDKSAEDNFQTFTFKIKDMSPEDQTTMVVTMAIVFVVVFVVIMAIVILFSVFIMNPIMVGCDRFFFKNLDEPANFSNVVYAFDHNYKNIIKTMFFKDLYVFLWSLLFVIPGIVKSYEYRMIPFLLADDPEMTREEAFRLSKEMMTGNKWKAFVLDLSFIGWELLSIVTCGILSIFFVNPYIFSTNAALYEKLRYGNEG
ncbi:MAG: DUF975 family protein [Eubacterium sp.]|nr:DUF975 family protein [Eubacterium sp.]